MDQKQEVIAQLAYQLWEQRGCPQGSANADWYEAERRLADVSMPEVLEADVEASGVDSFPASDPPATHGVDRRPSNADAKWQAAGGRVRRGATKRR